MFSIFPPARQGARRLRLRGGVKTTMRAGRMFRQRGKADVMFKVAVVGLGYIAQNHLEAYRSMSDVTIAAVVSRSAEKGEKAAQTYGCRHYETLDAALAAEKLDVVSICVPTYLHEEYVIKAARAGCHVLCEKPVTFTLESLDRMVAACEENGVRFMVAQVARWWPEFITFKDYIDHDKLGSLHMVYEKRICQHPTWATWHRDPAKSGGGLYDLNVHDIDYLYSLFGMPARLRAIGWKSPTGCWNHVCTSLEWKSGVKAVCETSLEMTGNFPFSIELRATGDKGTLSYALSAGVNINDGEHGSNMNWYPASEETVQPLEVEQTDMFAGEIREFLDAIRDNRPAVVTPQDSRNVLQIVLAIKKSLEEGVVVEL